MENNLENLTIGVFARTAGVNVETIRFYQRKGLLPEPDKPYGSIRRYGETDVTRVRFVKSAQRLGFSLDEIAELLRLEDGTHCEEASSLAEHKLKDVRERMADLARMEAVLSDLVCACHAVRTPCSPRELRLSVLYFPFSEATPTSEKTVRSTFDISCCRLLKVTNLTPDNNFLTSQHQTRQYGYSQIG